MLIYFLFVSVTNILLGMMLWHFYGPVLAPRLHLTKNELEAAPSQAAPSHEAPAAPAPPPAPVAATSPPAVEASPAPAQPPAEDLRPVRPAGSREVSAGDLADVMSELGVAPTAPAAEPPVAEAPEVAPAQPEAEESSAAAAVAS